MMANDQRFLNMKKMTSKSYRFKRRPNGQNICLKEDRMEGSRV